MKPNRYLFLLLLSYAVSTVAPLTAQDSTRVNTPPWRNTVDTETQMMLDDGTMTQRLLTGAGINVIKPELEYEVDEKKLYLDTEFRPYAITLFGGLTDTLLARIQLLDQVVEVVVDGRDLQVDSKSLRSLTAEDGRRFVAFPFPLVSGDPNPLLEVLFETKEFALGAYRRVEWREPSHQKTSYDSGNYKKRLDREDRVYLITAQSSEEVRKIKDLIELLPLEKRAEAQRYVKQERLRNREEDYVQLLTYLNRDR
jgi:hypothetical protein